MPAFPELYVIRHGQTEWNLAGRHQGRLDSPLTDLGRAQARGMGALMVRETAGRTDLAAVTSPLGRAQETAGYVFGAMGLVPDTDDRLCEVAFGAWEGMTHVEVLATDPGLERMIAQQGFNWHFRSPGGERLADLQHRAQAFLNDLPGPAVVVTHGVLSRVLRALWLGLDETAMLDLPGGQGVIFHLAPEHGQRMLAPEAGDPAAAEA